MARQFNDQRSRSHRGPCKLNHVAVPTTTATLDDLSAATICLKRTWRHQERDYNDRDTQNRRTGDGGEHQAVGYIVIGGGNRHQETPNAKGDYRAAQERCGWRPAVAGDAQTLEYYLDDWDNPIVLNGPTLIRGI